eukprot:CAMPEP_0197189792 /NCGR_PEP_ID=MMETSP1423-20130617/20397_1 /TAXON_ID=476441 /ORGANISM="Pseudo-nitzschia heimii, Strain UNC1101" /LENGTH=137 /DNA_ID=CAMNT_0042642007 /DNA_START=151 /DNA_END=561 /DNA_ORIENTATION=-
MAPIFASIGITPQIIDDERLRRLRRNLESISFNKISDNTESEIESLKIPLDVERLVGLIEPWQLWTFEEQVDLQEWVEPLNRIDACLSFYIKNYPRLLLIGPVERMNSKGVLKNPKQIASEPASTIEEVNSVPDTVR